MVMKHALYEFALVYLAISLSVLVTYSLAVRVLKQKRGPEAENTLFALGTWPRLLQTTLPFIMFLHFLLPAILFLLGFAAAAILAPVEGWGFSDTFEYVMCNIASLPARVSLTPQSVVGQLVDIVVALTVFTLKAVVLGIAANMGIISDVTNKIPETVCGVCVCLVAVPSGLFLLTVLLGAICAALESWDVWTGILFMISVVCGMQDPLTKEKPTTGTASFFALLCCVLELSIGGAIVGVIGSHPKVIAFISFLEATLAPADSQSSNHTTSKTNDLGTENSA